MRIAFVTNIFPPHVRGGYELGCLQVARAFSRLGHDVVVLTSLALGQLEKAPRVRDLPVREIFEPVFAFEGDMATTLRDVPAWSVRRTDAFGGVHFANATALHRELQDLEPDRIWLSNPVGIGPVGILDACVGSGVPVLFHLMDDVDRYVADMQREVYWTGRWRTLKRACRAVSCSTLTKAQNSKVGSYPDHRVIHSGVEFADIQVNRAARSGRALRFVYFGQVEPTKGVPQLVAAARALRERRGEDGFRLDILGPAAPSMAAELTREIEGAGLSRIVRLLGPIPREELLELLPGYDVAALLLKKEEPFGYAPVEAGAAGLPVIFTRGPGASECFPADYPLFVVNRDDASEVAAVMSRCIDDRERLPVLAESLRRELRRHCDFDRSVLPAYVDALQSLPASCGRPAGRDLLPGAWTYDLYSHLSAERACTAVV